MPFFKKLLQTCMVLMLPLLTMLIFKDIVDAIFHLSLSLLPKTNKKSVFFRVCCHLQAGPAVYVCEYIKGWGVYKIIALLKPISSGDTNSMVESE